MFSEPSRLALAFPLHSNFTRVWAICEKKKSERMISPKCNLEAQQRTRLGHGENVIGTLRLYQNQSMFNIYWM